MKSKTAAQQPSASLVSADEQLADLVKAGEAGVGDIVRVYEAIEKVYIESTQHLAPTRDDSGYSIGTLPR
jgi:hypothetical protein